MVAAPVVAFCALKFVALTLFDTFELKLDRLPRPEIRLNESGPVRKIRALPTPEPPQSPPFQLDPWLASQTLFWPLLTLRALPDPSQPPLTLLLQATQT